MVLPAAGLSLILFTFAVFFLPPPRPLLRWMVSWSAPMLLEGADSDSALRSVMKRAVRAYTNVALARELGNRSVEQGGSDEEILGRMMATVRSVVLAPRRPDEIRHATALWPALLSGVGYCDQTNGIVCRMAAHHFPKAELIALYTRDGRMSPHTVGRVWSEQRQDWLYFDAFYAQPVIFTRDAEGMPNFLPVDAGEVMPSREKISPSIYTLGGWKLNQFPGTFAMYLIDRLTPDEPVKIEASKSRRPVARPPAVAAASGAPAILEHPPEELVVYETAPVPDRPILRDPSVYRSVVKDYAAARVSHLLGPGGRAAYHAVVNKRSIAQRDDRAAEIASAAERFMHLAP
ncbi:MAG TPA: hypothetical protein VFO89_04875 [Thermoanaerobaculia bacterium]|nr:hypothetical protein [Thermoanaerobaculia bacterium]